MFITTTAEPLSAFLITMCGLSRNLFNPNLSSLVRLLWFLCFGATLSMYCLTDLWNVSSVLFGGFGLQLNLGLNDFWFSLFLDPPNHCLFGCLFLLY